MCVRNMDPAPEFQVCFPRFKKGIFCGPHIHISPAYLFADLKIYFLSKHTSNTYFSLKFFMLFGKTIFDAK